MRKQLLLPVWRLLVEPLASRQLATKCLYWIIMGRRLNLDSPQDFNEKLQWYKFHWDQALISRCTDKYGVRDYAIEQGCPDVLNEVYAVYDRVADISWDELPAKFALRCTHGCGFNIICDDKSKLSRVGSLLRLAWWMRRDYGRKQAEYQYDRIKPRIICERYIETAAGFTPNDYKIFCFQGRPHYVAIATDRSTRVRWHFLDIEWNRIDICLPEHNQGDLPIKPACWDRMLAVSVELSKPFPFVRVDFYDDNGRALLGEMTFLPSGGFNRGYYSEAGLAYLGRLFEAAR